MLPNVLTRLITQNAPFSNITLPEQARKTDKVKSPWSTGSSNLTACTNAVPVAGQSSKGSSTVPSSEIANGQN